MDMITYTSIFVILLLGEASAARCPPEEDIAPHCTCMAFTQDTLMTCKDIYSPEELIAPMRAVAKSKAKILSITLKDSSLMYLPHDIFRGTNIEKVVFYKSEIMSLSDTDTAFTGLENSLTEIRATDAEYVAEWDWTQLRNHTRLRLIDVHQLILGSVDKRFPELPELTDLGILRAKIHTIVDYAFSDLKKLTMLILKDNDIEVMKRNMLPDPANHLIMIDLSNNKLKELPEDFFANMSSLSYVLLDKNQFITLNEEPFSTVFGRLEHLKMSENPFRCDCRMRWLVDRRAARVFYAKCEKPDSLKGTNIKDLQLKSLRC